MALGHGPISGGPIVDNTEDFGAAPALFSRVDPSIAYPSPLIAWRVARNAWLATVRADPVLPPAQPGAGPAASGGGVFRGDVVIAVGSSFSHPMLGGAAPPAFVGHDAPRWPMRPPPVVRPIEAPVLGQASMPAFVSQDGPRAPARARVAQVHESTVQALVTPLSDLQPSSAWPMWTKPRPRTDASAWDPVGIATPLAVFVAESSGRVVLRPRLVMARDEVLSSSLVPPWQWTDSGYRPSPPRRVTRPDQALVATAIAQALTWLSTDAVPVAWQSRRRLVSTETPVVSPLLLPASLPGGFVSSGAVFRGRVIVAVVSAPVWPALAAPGLLTWLAGDVVRAVQHGHRPAIRRVDQPILPALVAPPGLLAWAPGDVPRVLRPRVWWLPIAGLGWTGFGPNGEIVLPPTPPESLWDDANITPPGPPGSLYGAPTPGLGVSPYDDPSGQAGASLYDLLTGPLGGTSPYDTPTVLIVIPKNLWDVD